MLPNTRGHTGGGLSTGRGFTIVNSTEQKLDTLSPTETEIVAVDNFMPAVLWTRYWSEAQGCDVFEKIIYQEHKSSIILENSGKASRSKRTKHINIR